MEAPLVWIYDKPPGRRVRYAWWRFIERHLPMLVIYLLVATLIGVVLAPFMLVTVPSGYVGVLWKRFGGGTVLNPSLLKNEGMRITAPIDWTKLRRSTCSSRNWQSDAASHGRIHCRGYLLNETRGNSD